MLKFQIALFSNFLIKIERRDSFYEFYNIIKFKYKSCFSTIQNALHGSITRYHSLAEIWNLQFVALNINELRQNIINGLKNIRQKRRF